MDGDSRKPVSISMLISLIRRIQATKKPEESRSAFIEKALLHYLESLE